MKILLVSDIHYSLKQFDWLVQVAPNFDLLVIAGDLLDVAGHADLDTQIVVVSQYLERLRGATRVLACSGNHDGDMKNDAGEYVADWLQDVREENLSVDGDTVDVGNLRATVCPWWDGPVTRENLSAMLDEARGEGSGRWLWIHHAPPDGSPVSWTGKQFAGDAHLLELLERLKPFCVFSGHIHHSPFHDGGSWVSRIDDTWTFNPGCEMGAPPAHIVIDFDAMEATWRSSMGEEKIDLAAPGDATPRPT